MDELKGMLIKLLLDYYEHGKNLDTIAIDADIKPILAYRDKIVSRVELPVKPACETLQRRFELYQRCINQIDDYLEYAYKSRDAEEIKKTIMGYIDLLTQKLSKSV